MAAVTGFFVILSVAGGVFFAYTMQLGSGFGTLGLLALTIVAIPTLISVLVTIGLWMFQRNRSVHERSSLFGPESR